jgi:hypothetical protein
VKQSSTPLLKTSFFLESEEDKRQGVGSGGWGWGANEKMKTQIEVTAVQGFIPENYGKKGGKVCVLPHENVSCSPNFC